MKILECRRGLGGEAQGKFGLVRIGAGRGRGLGWRSASWQSLNLTYAEVVLGFLWRKKG